MISGRLVGGNVFGANVRRQPEHGPSFEIRNAYCRSALPRKRSTHTIIYTHCIILQFGMINVEKWGDSPVHCARRYDSIFAGRGPDPVYSPVNTSSLQGDTLNRLDCYYDVFEPSKRIQPNFLAGFFGSKINLVKSNNMPNLLNTDSNVV